MPYGEILSTAWKTIWKHKAIPLFGLFSMLIPMLMGLLVGGMVFFSDPYALAYQLNRGEFGWLWPAIFGLELALALLSVLFSALGYAGTFKGTAQAEAGTEPVTFGGIWRGAWPRVWPVLGVIFLIGFSLMAVVAVPAFLGVLTAGVAFVCLMPVIFLLIPAALLTYTFMSLCMAVIVADDLGVIAALRRAWEILRANIWPLALLTLLLYLVQMAVSMVIALPMSMLPMLATPFLFAQDMSDPAQFFRLFGVLMAVMMPLMYLLQGLLLSYTNAVWMIAYLRLRGAPPARPPAPVAEPV
jgi:hypothetical protein